MASSRPSLKRSLLLSAFFAASLLTSDVFAQGTTPQTTPATTPAATTPRTSSSAQRTTTPASNTRSTSRQDPVSLPPLGDSSSVAAITDLPTLDNPGAAPIPTYPAATVPDTHHAPFMNHSTLPDGTVFIAVGAILAAFGLTVIVWRGIVACLLHRSVERASKAQHIATDKAANFGAPSHAYSFNERDSSPVHGSAAGLLAGRPPKRSHKTGMPTATPSQTNLFFSPTAAPGAGGLGGSRDTRFLPSGFYASASPLPSHNGSNSISMSTLRPSSRGRMGMGPSPPDSPLIAPRRDFSSSSLSLSTPSNVNNGRAPSAFLDDLLDDQQGGGAPHPQGPPQQQYNTPQRYPSGPDGQYYSHSPSPPGHRGY